MTVDVSRPIRPCTLLIPISRSLPSFLAWAQWLSWYRYSYEILIVNQWDGFGNITCPSSPTSTYTAALNDTATTTSAPHHLPWLFGGLSDAEPQPCTYPTGEAVIKISGFDKDAVLFNVAMLFVMLVTLRIMAFFALFARSRRNTS